MGVAGSERDVLKAFGGLKTANRFDISYRVGLSSNYVDYLCKYLVRGGYLRLVGRGRYALAPQGKKFIASLEHRLDPSLKRNRKVYLLGLEEKKFTVDRKLVKDVAGEVAKEVAKEVTKGIKLKQARAYPISEKEKISIKTDYVPSVEDETGTLESNIEEIGIKTDTEKSDIDKSVKLFSSIGKKKRGK